MKRPTVADAEARAEVIYQRPDDPWPLFGLLFAWPDGPSDRRARILTESGEPICLQPTSVWLFDDTARAALASGLTDLREYA